ncbi:DUF3592 domain-containing protein [Dyella sp.]|uniref:DUF3592 domain-containing protein n=1 Tax=Dyella sp. TaxID=1869338 RepID=UPI002ED45001
MSGVASNDGWRPLRRWEKAVFTILGGALLAWAGWHGIQTARFLARSIHVTGTIVANSGHPRIHFKATDGRDIEFVQNGGAWGDAGDAMTVVYDASNPKGSAHADTFLALWGQVIFCLPMALGLLAAAFLGGQIRYRAIR